jgi:hypothetical protein
MAVTKDVTRSGWGVRQEGLSDWGFVGMLGGGSEGMQAKRCG